MGGNGKTKCRYMAPRGERFQLAEPFKSFVALVCKYSVVRYGG